jgi:hypothetical protein
MRFVALFFVAALLLVGCGGSNDTASPPSTTSGEAPSPAESETEEGSAYAGYEIPEVDRGTCYKTERLGSRTSVTLRAKDLTLAHAFVPNCLTDVKADRVRVTVVGSERLHSLVMQGTDTELTIPPGKTKTAAFDLADGKAIYFACTFHPSMVGAFFR